MSASRPRRLLSLAAAAACVIALAACGGDGDPGVDPTATSTAEGQFGEVTPTPSADATPTNSATATPTSGGGGGGGGGGGSYPAEADDYGLAILAAIAADDDSRIVDLSSLNTAQYVDSQNYKSKNGQWTFANCDPGINQMCHYYNQTGDIATVGVESARLGDNGAVTSVSIEGGSYPTDAVNYAQTFASNWTYNGSYVHMRAYAVQGVIDFLAGKQKLNAGSGGVGAQPTACPSGHAGRTCVEVYAVGGSLTISYVLVLDPGKLGKPNAILAAS